jgi:flagella basal body P-ring formation protein FlgA
MTSPTMRSLALLLAAALVAAPTAGHAAPSPRPSVTVEAPTVRLGDLFSDAGPEARVDVAAAPAPGERTVFDVRRLYAIAQEHHLAWTPGSNYDEVVVERASRAIGGDAIAARLLAEIGMTRPIDNAIVQLDNGGIRLVEPAEADDGIAVDGLTVDPQSGRLSAYVSAPIGATDAARVRVTGRLILQVDLPVLNRSMAPGETITAADLSHRLVRREMIGADAIADAAALVGKTPRHSLRPDEIVRAGDVQVPVIVHRNDLVTIILDTPSLHLSAQAKALDDGTLGASIRVSNTSSNRVVDAIVRGPNMVSVSIATAPPSTAAYAAPATAVAAAIAAPPTLR